ncbi:MAG: hypothetical protein AB7P49_19360, partial [Bdellovibrionales bacterium]
MLSKMVIVLALVIPSLSFAEKTLRRGTLEVRNEATLEPGLSKSGDSTYLNISILYSEASNEAFLNIDGERLHPGIREGKKISAYSAKPRQYFYFVLDLAPSLMQDPQGQPVPVLENTKGSMVGCGAGANAILTSYKGD